MAENSSKTGDRPGRFKKGKSGNPGGRPKKTAEELDLIAACKDRTPAALAVIESIMLKGENERNKLSAALALIERAYGKPKETVEANVTGRIETITRRIVRPQ
ncbi:hypothetical protein KDX40_04835 [Burkholderia ambifaria]|uniref:DUF5681 domain-containing protein n=1 Tax=Burkholderia ambifaria TaxID=152480 RepID=UPI001B9F69FC|nr:DUF5681 domain-containing protein [Burkholderia ambifaria]MBR8343063.1 hypothetical protein [Burkholderia ambifaria]